MPREMQCKQIRNDFMASAIDFRCIFAAALQFNFCDSNRNNCVDIDKYLFLVSKLIGSGCNMVAKSYVEHKLQELYGVGNRDTRRFDGFCGLSSYVMTIIWIKSPE